MPPPSPTHTLIFHVSTGIKHNFQINDLTDCADRSDFADKLGKTVISLEGVPISCNAV